MDGGGRWTFRGRQKTRGERKAGTGSRKLRKEAEVGDRMVGMREEGLEERGGKAEITGRGGGDSR